MDFIQSIVLGAVQGITEFLPISSSAHLVLVPWIFGWDYQGLGFDTALHFGTVIAIVAFFWKDWLNIIFRAFKPRSYKLEARSFPPNLLWQILAASIPAAIAGYFLSNYVENYLHSPILLAINLIVFGILLWLVDIAVKKSKLTINSIKWGQSLIVGLAQVLSLVPGVSRSGITMTAGRGLGLSREDSARFSFLLSTPAIIGAFLFEAKNFNWANLAPPFWLAIIVTTIVGFLTIKYLLQYLKKGSFLVFTVYRVILAVIIILLFYLR